MVLQQLQFWCLTNGWWWYRYWNVQIDFKRSIMKNNSAMEIVYVLYWWLNSAPWPLSHWVIPRRPGPEASLPSLLTYSPTPNRALRPQQQPRHRFSSHADRARPNVPVLRPQAAPPSVAPHPSSSRPFVRRCRGAVPKCRRATRELETATTAVVGRPGRISEVLVTSTRPNASQATHRARLGLLWSVFSD